MKIKSAFTCLLLVVALSAFSQPKKQPVLVTMKDGSTLDALHFGQLKCGTDVYSTNFVIIRGKFMDSVTEMKNYAEIEKIVLEGYSKAPVASVGNEKGTLRIFKKDGVSVTLEEAEVVMSCYGTGDKYNEIIVQIMNPLTNQIAEQSIETRNIQSIIFK